MRRFTKRFIAVALLIGCVLVMVEYQSEREPSHNGRTLSNWYEVFRENESAGFDGAETRAEEASEAIQAIGTNALPLLVKRIQVESPGPIAIRVVKTIGGIPWIGEWVTKLVYRHANRANDATAIFMIFGSRAAPAIPDLYTVAVNADTQEVLDRAIYCLGAIGDPAAATLAQLLVDPTKLECERTLYWLSLDAPFYFTTNTGALLEPVIHLTTNQNARVARFATKATGQLGQGDVNMIPVLTNALGSNDPNVRYEALMALARYEVAHLIRPALTDQSERVRITATNILQRLPVSGIAP